MASSVCCQSSYDVSTGQTGGSGVEVDVNECGFTGGGDGPIFALKLVEQVQFLFDRAQDSSQDSDIFPCQYFPQVLQA